MKTTDYFRDNVLLKRPYIRADWCAAAIAHPLKREIQAEDGRNRHWGWIAEVGRHLRVVTLADGETVHNAFYDN